MLHSIYHKDKLRGVLSTRGNEIAVGTSWGTACQQFHHHKSSCAGLRAMFWTSVCHVLLDITAVGPRRTYKILVSNHIHKDCRVIMFSYVYHCLINSTATYT